MDTEQKRTIRLLSVCAPVYNEEDLVEVFYARTTAALEGFDYELIIVNDGCRDGTPEILDRHAATIFGISSGGSWRSASSIATTSPRACSRPAVSAA